MTPTRTLAQSPAIQSATNYGAVYEVSLQDGTTLWIPKDADNSDFEKLSIWAADNALTLGEAE